MKSLTFLFYYILSFALTFGSVNPFTVQVDDSVIGEQQGYTPILLAICVLFSLFDKALRKDISTNACFVKVLLWFDFILLISELWYDCNSFGNSFVFLIKLIACQVGFIVFMSYFKLYPIVLKRSLKLYQLACVLIISLYFMGALSSMLYYSNGRLFLFGINPNTYSFMMGLGLLYALNDFLNRRQTKFLRLFDLYSVLILLMYIILSGSRGTFLFCSLGCLILIGKQFLKNFNLLLPALLIGFFVIYNFVKVESQEISLFDRLSEMKEGDSRSELIDHAFQIFSNSPIFIGVGSVGYTQESLSRFRDARDSHNMIISSLVLTGLIGTYLLLRFLYILFDRIRKNHYKNRLALALLIYMILISLKTGWILTYTLMWYIFSVSMAMNEYTEINNLTYKKK